MGKGNDFDLNLNSESNPSIVTIGNNPALASSIGPVIGLMLTAITKQLNQQNRLKSVILIDEFPTVYIPNVENIPATARSNKVATILACQDITQVVDRYGREKADTILSNLGNQLYGRTTNPQTAKRVSELFGRDFREMMSSSQTDGSFFTGQKASTSRSYSLQESDLVRPQEVTGLDTGTFFCILSEGATKMGKNRFTLNQNYVHSDLPVLRTISRDELMQNYREIKNNIKVFFAD
jgi:type IV secretory pathway TraG/TraD family ATPase VirD4